MSEQMLLLDLFCEIGGLCSEVRAFIGTRGRIVMLNAVYHAFIFLLLKKNMNKP